MHWSLVATCQLSELKCKAENLLRFECQNWEKFRQVDFETVLNRNEILPRHPLELIVGLCCAIRMDSLKRRLSSISLVSLWRIFTVNSSLQALVRSRIEVQEFNEMFLVACMKVADCAVACIAPYRVYTISGTSVADLSRQFCSCGRLVSACGE